VGKAGGGEKQVELAGHKTKPAPATEPDRAKAARMAVAAFDGKADLGGDLGGECEVKGEVTNETFTGTVESKGKEIPFTLKRVFLQPPTLGQAAPEGAIVLLGAGNMDAWNVPPHWVLDGDGAIQTQSNNLTSKQEFGDAQYHVEFMTPFVPNESGQARGNSGVYLQGRYEVQVLDSFGEKPKWDYCGGIYKVAAPIVTASLPPLQWQTYDITFYAPKFDASGKKVKNAEVTIVQNGITIHDKLVLPDVTPGGVSDKEAPVGVLMLQDHHNDVKYRNIWVKPLG
jgi:hypothetical protein